MRERSIVVFALFASFLVVTQVPASAAAGALATGSIHTNASDFQQASTLTNLTVSGSGDDASVVFQSGFSDGFETGLSGYAGQTGVFETTASEAYLGSYSLSKNSGDHAHHGVYSDSDTWSAAESKTASVWYYHGDDNNPRGGVFLSDGSGNGYIGYVDPTYTGGSGGLSIGRVSGSNTYETELVDTSSLSLSKNTWYKVFLEHDGGNEYTVRLEDTAGNTVAGPLTTTDSTYSPTRIGSWAYDSDLYLDELSGDGGLSNSGQYVGGVHDVSNAEQAFVDLSLSNVDATVRVEGSESGSSWTTVATDTKSASGNYSLDISGTSYEKWRVQVDFQATGQSAVASLNSEGIEFQSSIPEVEEATATPNGTSVDSSDVNLSVPISDADFSTVQGDSLDVEFYVDGSLYETQSVSSNQTVSASVTELSTGNHTWHVEVVDQYGNSGTSSTWSFEVKNYPPEVDNTQATPQSGTQFNNETVEVSVPVSDPNFADPVGENVTVDLHVDGAEYDSTTISSNQTASFTVSGLSNGSHSWYVTATDSAGETATSSTFSFEVLHYAPVVNNSAASPRDGEPYPSEAISLSVPVTDRDFDEASGDSVEATVILDGQTVDTQTITTNGTVTTNVSVDDGGLHTWYVEFEDEYGLTSESETFTFESPLTLQVHEGSDTSTLVTSEIDVEIFGTAQSSNYRDTRTVTNGQIAFENVPNEQLMVRLNASGYQPRQVIINDPYSKVDRHTVLYSNSSSESFEQCFALDSKGAGFAPDQTWLIMQSYINDSWRDAGGSYFGAANVACVGMQDGTEYRLLVEDGGGDRRALGGFTGDSGFSQQVISLTVEGVSLSLDQGGIVRWEVSAERIDSQSFAGEGKIYFDMQPGDATVEDLHIRIHERGNESNILEEVEVTGEVGSYSGSFPLNATEANQTWVVAWDATVNGEVVEDSDIVDIRGQALQTFLPPEYEMLFVGGFIILIGGVFGFVHAPMGSIVTAGMAALFHMMGVLDLPGAAVVFALTIAVIGFMVSKTGTGGGV
ncbi:Ig-like domain-containing protein [Haloarchaeobius sp. DFWS5]|uniref:Ig-like domain-containing protein n=1 Tax=Haloarchaeobius sp. DFWS5 TaxID=3446114 RepID=UPI003EBEDF56